MRKFHFQQLLAKDVMNKTFAVKDGDFKVSSWTGKHVHCVQVAVKPEGVAVHDDKDKSKTTLFFNHGEWNAFLKGVKAGEFDF